MLTDIAARVKLYNSKAIILVKVIALRIHNIDPTLLQTMMASQCHMAQMVFCGCHSFCSAPCHRPLIVPSPLFLGSSDTTSNSSRQNFYEPPRRTNFQPSKSQYSPSHHSPWNDSAYSSTAESAAPNRRELRSVLPPPAGYTQRHQSSQPSRRLSSNRQYSNDESITPRSDPPSFGRKTGGDSLEQWSQTSSDKSTTLTPITRSPFRPTLPARGVSSPFPIQHNPQMRLGRESSLLNASNNDVPSRSFELDYLLGKGRSINPRYLPDRIADDHKRADDVNKRRRLWYIIQLVLYIQEIILQQSIAAKILSQATLQFKNIDGSTKDDISTLNTLDVAQKNERNKKTWSALLGFPFATIRMYITLTRPCLQTTHFFFVVSFIFFFFFLWAYHTFEVILHWGIMHLFF